ncbi:hypothetical protein AAZX31_02G152500 [Glycine max]|nr:hypothetical protein GYH30_004187 [Glycine max]
MSLNSQNLHLWWRLLSFLLLLLQFVTSQFVTPLNSDGIHLLKFKYSILSDPLSVLKNWNYDDVTPCSWHGVACSEIGAPGTPDFFRSGCCKPAEECQFSYVNPTTWMKPTNVTNQSNPTDS